MKIQLPSITISIKTLIIIVIGIELIVAGFERTVEQLYNMTILDSDFTQDYVASTALRNGLSIYTPAENGLEINTISTNASRYMSNNHTPFNAILFLPFTSLPYNIAVIIWCILLFILCFWIFYIVFKELRIAIKLPWIMISIGFGLCWYYLQGRMAFSNSSLALAACIIGCWVMYRNKHDFPSGVLIGIATMVKLFPGLFVLYFLLRRRWTAAFSAIATISILQLLTLIIVGKDDIIKHIFQVIPYDVARFGAYSANISLTGAFSRLLVGRPWVQPIVYAPEISSILVAIISIVLLIIFVKKSIKIPKTQHGEDASFAIACVIMLIISPITWGHIIPLLVLPFGFLINDLKKYPQKTTRLFVILTIIIILIPFGAIGGALFIISKIQIPWFINLIFTGPTIGLFLLLWMLNKRSDTQKLLN